MVSENVGMFIGAVATGAVDAGLESYGNINPAVKSTVPYMVINPAIPPVNCWLSDAGTPLVLYALGKLTKKDLLMHAAKGAGIYGFCDLLGQTVYRLAMVAAGKTPLVYVMKR